MGWKDLFKSKAVKVEADPRLRWFGKLPTYADYYSSQTDADWAVEFNDWVLKGWEVYVGRQREAGRDTKLPSAACALRLPKSQMTVLATIQDYGGDMRGRPFPLCFYVGVPSPAWPGPTSDRTLPALRVLRDLTTLREQVVRFAKAPGRFDSVFGGREIDLSGVDDESADASVRTGPGSMPMADWLAAVQSCLKVDQTQTWLNLISGWGDNIAKLESEDFGPTLRFPLAMALPFEAQVAGWLRWLEHRLALKERLVSILICKDLSGGTGRLTVVARDIVPEDFLLFTSLAEGLSYVDDACGLTAAAGPGAEEAPVGTVSGTPASAPERWQEFVESGPAGLTSSGEATTL